MHLTPTAGLSAAFFFMAMAAGCDRAGTPTSATSATPASDAAAARSPTAGVTPQPLDVPASSAVGPADASTAIGGMTGAANSGGGGGSAGGAAPAPTAGDGAASAPVTAPAASR